MLYSFQVLNKLEFSRQSFEKYQKPKLTKIRPVGAELFHASGRTDMTKLKPIAAFGNFAQVIKNTFDFMINFSSVFF